MNEADNEFTITKRFDAPAEKVFAYFTDPELLARWHTPNLSVAPSMAVDLTVGGSYRFEMTDPEGNVHVAVGRYLEIVPDRKLVFTWAWEGTSNPATTVTVLFEPKGNATEVSLHHAGFADSDTLMHHRQGWKALLAHLTEALV